MTSNTNNSDLTTNRPTTTSNDDAPQHDGDLDESSLFQTARLWAEQDPNETTAAHVMNLIHTKNVHLVKKLFSAPRIGFGTAGLRAEMKPGPAGMNDLVVVQTAQGLARYCRELLLSSDDDDNTCTSRNKLGVVIGYDHRANSALQLSSHQFALLTALVFTTAGWDCFLLDGFVATPLVPFCLSYWQKQLQQQQQQQQLPVATTAPILGIMITASHNPKQDAGYKVYWKDGCQIRSPVDKGMAAGILQNLTPWIDYRALLEQQRQQHALNTCGGQSRPAETQQVVAAYYQALSGLVSPRNVGTTESSRKPPRFCYTAMHGVGYRFVQAALTSPSSAGAGLLPPDLFYSVPDQQEPDPDFPTVVFPNPEEQGALDVACSFAAQHDCDVVLANDPDADRLALAERQNKAGHSGAAWTIFTGDQIGSMLGLWMWEQLRQQQQQHDQRPIAMCASTVSSKLLAEIARVEGFHFQETLTGFKWIGSTAAELNRTGYQTIFCYEEALGFCCGDVIFDKDGISALLCLVELTMSVYRQGKTLAEHLQGMYDKYGEFVSNNGYYVIQDMAVVSKIMDHMTMSGNFAELTTVGPYPVESVRYLGEPGYDSTTVDRKPTLPISKSSPMMTIRFVNGGVAQFRASGTEPKFKYYMELKGQPGISRQAVTAELKIMSEILLETLVQPTKFGLVQPTKQQFDE